MDKSPNFTDGSVEFLELKNPVSDQFDAFVFGNAVLSNRPYTGCPECEQTETQGERSACAAHKIPVVQAGAGKGKTVVICGAGPTLRDHAAEYAVDGAEVWGCNSALTWLLDHDYQCTHGFSIDQTEAMLEEWATAPDVEYLIASTVHCKLTEHLTGHGRAVRFFHNYVGMKNPETWNLNFEYEDFLYFNLYEPTVRVGSGLNSVNRAICLAIHMEFDRIIVLGADCALGKDDELHADGGGLTASGATAVTLEATIDGRFWKTKPDMIISAVFLVKMKHKMGDALHLVGDTLPNALMEKDDEFLARLPRLQSKPTIDLDGDSGDT